MLSRIVSVCKWLGRHLEAVVGFILGAYTLFLFSDRKSKPAPPDKVEQQGAEALDEMRAEVAAEKQVPAVKYVPNEPIDIVKARLKKEGLLK